jgi:hypothetical protein
MTAFGPRVRLRYSVIRGRAKRLSTGFLKKPWIWGAWRSMVMTLSARRARCIRRRPGRGWRRRLVLLVALGVAEIGDDRGYETSAGALEGVHPEQELHEIVVGGVPDGLDDVDVPAAHVLAYFYIGIAFGEGDGARFSQGMPR